MVSGELTVTGVGIRQYRAVGIGCSLGSALLPGEIPPGAVVVVGGIADGIVGDALTVHLGQQVGPGAVAVGVAVAVAPGGNLGFPPGVCCYLLVIQTVPQFRELQIFLAAPNSFWLFPKAAVHIVRDFY